MKISLTQLRRSPKPALDHVRAGEEVIVTDDGLPAFRIVPIDHPTRLQQLVAEGVVRLPSKPVDFSALRSFVNGTGPVPEAE